jgi:acyl-CoA thioesterase-1
VGDYTVLWTGDSITDCGRREDPAGLGHGYVRRLAAAPALVGVRTVNTGVGGDLSGDLALRWADDVLAYRPDVVSVLIGINDVWRRYDGSGRITSSAEFEGNLRGMLGKLPSGVRVVLIEPFVLPVDAVQERWEGEDLGAKRAVVRGLAAEFGAAFVAAQAVFSAASSAGQSGTQAFSAGQGGALAPDGVHPSEAGHALLAEAWLAAVPAEWLRP